MLQIKGNANYQFRIRHNKSVLRKANRILQAQKQSAEENNSVELKRVKFSSGPKNLDKQAQEAYQSEDKQRKPRQRNSDMKNLEIEKFSFVQKVVIQVRNNNSISNKQDCEVQTMV
mmetsp:Transcript_18963/g.18106  ORF Transcript_18963/g.18106 Transcript_18963/m.18106 type:complete len:116 (-) Transcript_18963:68-415(-)